jgi:hypothetical protein
MKISMLEWHWSRDEKVLTKKIPSFVKMGLIVIVLWLLDFASRTRRAPGFTRPRRAGRACDQAGRPRAAWEAVNNAKSHPYPEWLFVVIVLWRLPTLPGLTQVSSAVPGLTSLFGMGRGEHRANSHQQDL